MFNATFNNISVISWRFFLLVEETGMSGENHAQTCRKTLINLITYNVVSSTPRHEVDSNSQLQW